MSLDDFWDFTPRQFQLKMEGKREYEEMIQRFEWERVRFQTTALINKDRKKQNQIKQKDLIKFEWEEKVDVEKIKADRKKALYLIAKENKKNK